MKQLFQRVKNWLSGLSFRTGVIVLASCVVFYALSFAQLLIPMSAAWHTVLWVVFFGLAKTTQYGGLAILGVEGYRRLINYFRRKKSGIQGEIKENNQEDDTPANNTPN